MTQDESLGMKDRFIEICRTEIHREGIDDLLQWLENSDFFVAPASTKFHGAYDHALCEHSLDTYDELDGIANEFPALNISRESIAICGLFHDICKANFYKKEKKNVKDVVTGKWNCVDAFVVDDKFPIGHGEKSCIILQWFMKLTVDELLAIRYHMGGFDSSVKGGDFSISKAYDSSPLAVMLHLADMKAAYLRNR